MLMNYSCYVFDITVFKLLLTQGYGRYKLSLALFDRCESVPKRCLINAWDDE